MADIPTEPSDIRMDATIDPLAPEVRADSAAVAAFWADYCAATGTDPASPHPASAFGSGPAMADELLALVLSGRKRAAAALLAEHEDEGVPWDLTGTHEIVLDGRGRPACVLRYICSTLSAFDAVDADFASAEGEGDGSLAWWREAHRRYFDPLLRTKFGRALTGGEMLVLQRFALVWPPDRASPGAQAAALPS